MEFNAIWTKEKNNKLRQLIKEGKSIDFIKEYFGEDLKYHPKKKYNSGGSILPYDVYQKISKNINEIIINPEETYYIVSTTKSDIYKNKYDRILTFEYDNVNYVIVFMFFVINNIETYNIIFTTEKQWNEYKKQIFDYSKKGYVTDDEHNNLSNIISKELNKLYSVLKRLSWCLLDFYKTNLSNSILSIGETENLTKIELYRNIIKNSFENFEETKEIDNGNLYFLYKIN